MTPVIVSLVILIILVVIAMKMGFSNREDGAIDPEQERMIRASGIYSIVRESPRAALFDLRPDEEEIGQYLSENNKDINGKRLDVTECIALLGHWEKQREANLQAIENGDKTGASFYYYDPCGCPVCVSFITKGNFVTREEIHDHPLIVPPFHIGCACMLSANGDDGGKTTSPGMSPFFKNGRPPQLPKWTKVVSINN